MRTPHDIAKDFIASSVPHFCTSDRCNCIARLAEIIQWARHEGAVAQHRQDARRRISAPVGPHRIHDALMETRETITRRAGGAK